MLSRVMGPILQKNIRNYSTKLCLTRLNKIEPSPYRVLITGEQETLKKLGEELAKENIPSVSTILADGTFGREVWYNFNMFKKVIDQAAKKILSETTTPVNKLK